MSLPLGHHNEPSKPFRVEDVIPFPSDELRRDLAALAAKGVYIGTSSWKYEGWLGHDPLTSTLMNITPPPIPPDNRVLYFQRDKEQFLFLSHFHPSPIVLDGETWPTVEHYFQAQRSHDAAYRQAIREEKSPGKVKHLSKSPDDTTRGGKRFSWFRSNQAVPRADWADVELDVMRTADGAKFTQNPDFGALLLVTGDSELIEDSPWDAFWGTGPDENGLNWAGKILMEIRQELRASHPVVQPKPQ